MVVYLDTNILIYTVENPPAFGACATAHLTTVRGRGDTFMASDLTRMECLVGPLRSGNVALEAQFRGFLAATGM
jgi:hypothetical protein